MSKEGYSENAVKKPFSGVLDRFGGCDGVRSLFFDSEVSETLGLSDFKLCWR